VLDNVCYVNLDQKSGIYAWAGLGISSPRSPRSGFSGCRTTPEWHRAWRWECPRRDESADFVRAQLTRLGIQLHGIGAQEQMRVVPVELRALVRVDRILDRQRVQLKLLGDRRELRLGWVAIVQPHTCVLVLEVLRDVPNRKVLEHELSLAVQSSARHERTI
jgi:hypothetical protein